MSVRRARLRRRAERRRASRYVDGIDADVVLISPLVTWYGQDFVRNDPPLRNRPKRMFMNRIDRDLAGRLRGMCVHVLQPDELRPFEMAGIGP